MALDSTPEFKRDLEDVFEERAGGFSNQLVQLLEMLWNQGVLAGRERERHDQRQLEGKAVRSECGNYLCIPVPKEMLVLEGAEAGMGRIESRLKEQPKSTDARPLEEMIASMDTEILEKLASQARALDPLECHLVGVLAPPAPRIPSFHIRKNEFNWVMGVDLGMGKDSAWMQQFSSPYGNSATTSTEDASMHYGTASLPAGKSGK